MIDSPAPPIPPPSVLKTGRRSSPSASVSGIGVFSALKIIHALDGQRYARRNDPDAVAKARDALAHGFGINRVATLVGLSNGTVQRIKGEMEVAAACQRRAREMYLIVSRFNQSILNFAL